MPSNGLEAINRELANVRQAAEANGRGFYIMYDIARADPAEWLRDLVADWQRLLKAGLTASPAYQRHRGRPVLEIAGIGNATRPGTPEEAVALLTKLRNESASYGGVTLIGLVPTNWRTLDRDSKTDLQWARVFRSFDVISPWTVGRYRSRAAFERYLRERLIPDMAETGTLRIDYLPVVFPGFSAFNLHHSGRGDFRPRNSIPRDCGRFFWAQVTGDIQAGARMLFGAMFDEVDEGTALFKLAPGTEDIPKGAGFLSLDADGCRLPSDYYLQLSARASELLKRASRN